MTKASAASAIGPADRAWSRHAEGLANQFRFLALAGFYLIELANYHGLSLGVIEIPPAVDRPFHEAVTALAVAWLLVGVLVRLALNWGFFPNTLGYLATAADVMLLTSILMIADGPKSPLLIGYFVLLAGAGLRLDEGLARFATIATVGAYLYLSGYARWFTDRSIRVPRYQQFIFLLGLVLVGVIVEQTVHQARRRWNSQPRQG